MIIYTCLLGFATDIKDPKELITNDSRLTPRLKDRLIQRLPNFHDRIREVFELKEGSYQFLNLCDQNEDPDPNHFNTFFLHENWLVHTHFTLVLIYTYYVLLSNNHIYFITAHYLNLQDDQYVKFKRSFRVDTDQKSNLINALYPVKIGNNADKPPFLYTNEPIPEEENLTAMAQIQINNFFKFKDQIFNTITESILEMYK